MNESSAYNFVMCSLYISVGVALLSIASMIAAFAIWFCYRMTQGGF